MTNIVVSFMMRAKNAFASIRKAWTRSIHGVVASPSTAPDQRRAGSGLSSAKETVADAHEGSATDMLVEAQDDQNGVDAIQSHPSSNEGAFAGGPSPSSTAPALLPAHAVAAAKDDSEDDSQGSAIFHPSHVTLHPSSSGGPSPSSAPPIQPPAHGASAAQDDSLGSAVSYRSTRKGEKLMSRIVKCGLIQTSQAASVAESLETIRNAQTERTLKYIDQTGAEGVQMLCMQEIFTGPYFCAEQNTPWYRSAAREGESVARAHTSHPRVTRPDRRLQRQHPKPPPPPRRPRLGGKVRPPPRPGGLRGPPHEARRGGPYPLPRPPLPRGGARA